MNLLPESPDCEQEQSAFSPRPIGLERVMSSVQRLAGASSARLFDYCCETGIIEPMAGRLPAVPVASLDAVLFGGEASASDTLFTRWIDDASAEGEVLLVKLVDRPPRSVFLMLAPADQSDIARSAMQRSLPDIVVLLRYHLRFMARLQETDEMGSAAREALDHNECGVIAVRADHSVVFSNTAGSAHLAEGRGLRLRRGVLRPADHGKAIRFEAALDSVIDPIKVAAGRRRRASVLMLDGMAGSDPTIVVVAPAGAVPAPDAGGRGAAAIVYVLPFAPGETRGLDTLCRLMGLSRVECALITHLLAGLTLNEAAGRMQIKIDTARTYLKQVFVKTGMHRQTDLVAMMTRYLRAIRGDFDFQAV